MVLSIDSGISTQIEGDSSIDSNQSLPEHFQPRHRVYGIPALLLLFAVVPTSASIQVSQQIQPVRPSFIEMQWRSRREEDPFETEFYTPVEVGYWADASPMKIPIRRYFLAKVRYWGPLRLLPIAKEIS